MVRFDGCRLEQLTDGLTGIGEDELPIHPVKNAEALSRVTERVTFDDKPLLLLASYRVRESDFPCGCCLIHVYHFSLLCFQILTSTSTTNY
jgi:hypothetical protein